MATTNTTTGERPAWYDQYAQSIADMGGVLAQEDYTPYQGPRIAEFTPEQQQAFANVKDAQGMWKPYVDQGLAALNTAQGGLNTMANMTTQAGTFDRPTFDNTYMDIYSQPMREMQAVADRVGQRNFQNTTLKGLNDNFTGSGQFGTGRHQILGADAASQAQAQIEEAKAGIGMDATKNAMADYLSWSKQQGSMGNQMGTFAGNQARTATDLMNFGLGTQNAAMADASALGNIGAQQQQANQQNLDLAYNDFQQQQNFPWQQLDKWNAAVQGSSPPSYQVPAATTVSNPWAAGLAGGLGAWSMASAFK